ncbi:DUF7344 domain-containing protein [Haloprofundus salilacus]|uniref:DUF7344 domain-containing protein n=1 Tax=Haloprofundus salilacus TaxID=2876190 RepID=UPI001CCECDB5|nr:hypothetical protein [Haloprofundus salilacus]
MIKNLGSPTEETIASGIRDARAVELFDALSDQCRLRMVDHLAESNGPVALADLAQIVAAMETGTPVEGQSEDSYRTTYLNLYHNHVPKLVHADVVDYDENRKTIELVDSAELSTLLQFVVVERGPNEASKCSP